MVQGKGEEGRLLLAAGSDFPTGPISSVEADIPPIHLMVGTAAGNHQRRVTGLQPTKHYLLRGAAEPVSPCHDEVVDCLVTLIVLMTAALGDGAVVDGLRQ